MADGAHIQTDKTLEEMERHLFGIYTRAQSEVGQAWKDYLKESAEEIKDLQDAYDSAKKAGDQKKIKETGKKLAAAKREATITNQRFKDLSQQMAEQLLHINETALAYINGELPEIYALNYNSLAPSVDGVGGYSFTLTDADTVRNLATSDKSLLPYKVMNGAADIRWNVAKINAEVMQGILQGESMDKIAGRFSKVLGMNANSAIRNARTSVTGAENKGRQDSYERAEKDGIILKREWVATNDSRTRDAHRLLNGRLSDVKTPFSSELGPIMYPGDPHADPANVYNCRCTLIAKVEGFNRKIMDFMEQEKPAAKKEEPKKQREQKPKKQEKKPEKRTYTMKQLDGMSRNKLVGLAKEIYIEEAVKAGGTKESALKRFDALIPSNSTSYLKKYIHKRLKK